MMYKCTTNAVLVGKHCVISHVCSINFWNQNKTHHYNFKIAPRSCFEMCSMVLGCIFLIRALLHKYAQQEALSILTNQEKSQCVCVWDTDTLLDSVNVWHSHKAAGKHPNNEWQKHVWSIVFVFFCCVIEYYYQICAQTFLSWCQLHHVW